MAGSSSLASMHNRRIYLAVVCLINQERAKAHLEPLTQVRPLGVASLAHARAAVSLRWWKPGADWHTNPRTGSTVVSRIRGAGYCPSGSWQVAETAYTGPGPYGTPRAAVHWWVYVSRSGHREIILSPKLTEIGMAAVAGSAAPGGTGPAGSYVADFGRCA